MRFSPALSSYLPDILLFQLTVESLSAAVSFVFVFSCSDSERSQQHVTVKLFVF